MCFKFVRKVELLVYSTFYEISPQTISKNLISGCNEKMMRIRTGKCFEVDGCLVGDVFFFEVGSVIFVDCLATNDYISIDANDMKRF